MLLLEHSCCSCKESFKSEQALNQHHEYLQAFASIFCKSCRNMFRLEESSHHHDVVYYCRICHSYLTNVHFFDHKCFHKKSTQNKASKSKVICDNCKKVFFSKTDLLDHIQECKISRNLILCKCCKKQFLSCGELESHINSIRELGGNEALLTCSKCHLNFENECILKDHIKRIHVNCHKSVLTRKGVARLKKYQCRFCEEQFTYKNDKSSHEKQLHATNIVTCSICQKELPFRRLGPHSRWHRTREKYKTRPSKVCDICGFASKFIARHMKIHREERRYKCNVCSKSFKLSSCLSNHKLVHSNVAKHKCNVCDKAFKNNFNLQVHLRSHDVVKPFPCMVCEKTFTTKQSRDNHLKTHGR